MTNIEFRIARVVVEKGKRY